MDTQSMTEMSIPEYNDPTTEARCRMHKKVVEEEVRHRRKSIVVEE